MLPWYVGEDKPKTLKINFKAAKEVLVTAEEPTIENKRFERINTMMACKSYIKNKDFPENKKIFITGFKHIKTDEYIPIGCDSEEIYENEKRIHFWSDKLLNEEIEKRDFIVTRWLFLNSVKRNNFKGPVHMFVLEYNKLINFFIQEGVICFENPSVYAFRHCDHQCF